MKDTFDSVIKICVLHLTPVFMPQGSLKNKRRTRLAKQKQDQPASTMPKYVQTCRSFFLGTTICLNFGNKLCFTHKTKQNKHGVFPCPLLPLARRQTFTGSALFRTKCNNSLKFRSVRFVVGSFALFQENARPGIW